MSDIDPAQTKPEWPGWSFGEFERYLNTVLPIVTPVPGSPLQSRAETIDHAWRTPASVSGAYVELIFSVKEWAGDDAFRAAQRWMDNMAVKVAPSTSFTIQGTSMPQLIIPGVFLVSINSTSGGQDVVNVVGVRNSGGTAQGAADAVAAAWKVTAGPLAALASGIQFTGTRAMDLSSADGAIADAPSTNTLGGAGAGALATNAACALVKWNGGTRSASSRGRLYFGPLNEANVNSDGRTIAAASVTLITTAFNNFRASLSNANYPLVVVSRLHASAQTVTSSSVESVIATQRRRIRG